MYTKYNEIWQSILLDQNGLIITAKQGQGNAGNVNGLKYVQGNHVDGTGTITLYEYDSDSRHYIRHFGPLVAEFTRADCSDCWFYDEHDANMRKGMMKYIAEYQCVKLTDPKSRLQYSHFVKKITGEYTLDGSRFVPASLELQTLPKPLPKPSATATLPSVQVPQTQVPPALQPSEAPQPGSEQHKLLDPRVQAKPDISAQKSKVPNAELCIDDDATRTEKLDDVFVCNPHDVYLKLRFVGPVWETTRNWIPVLKAKSDLSWEFGLFDEDRPKDDKFQRFYKGKIDAKPFPIEKLLEFSKQDFSYLAGNVTEEIDGTISMNMNLLPEGRYKFKMKIKGQNNLNTQISLALHKRDGTTLGGFFQHIIPEQKISKLLNNKWCRPLEVADSTDKKDGLNTKEQEFEVFFEFKCNDPVVGTPTADQAVRASWKLDKWGDCTGGWETLNYKCMRDNQDVDIALCTGTLFKMTRPCTVPYAYSAGKWGECESGSQYREMVCESQDMCPEPDKRDCHWWKEEKTQCQDSSKFTTSPACFHGDSLAPVSYCYEQGLTLPAPTPCSPAVLSTMANPYVLPDDEFHFHVKIPGQNSYLSVESGSADGGQLVWAPKERALGFISSQGNVTLADGRRLNMSTTQSISIAPDASSFGVYDLALADVLEGPEGATHIQGQLLMRPSNNPQGSVLYYVSHVLAKISKRRPASLDDNPSEHTKIEIEFVTPAWVWGEWGKCESGFHHRRGTCRSGGSVLDNGVCPQHTKDESKQECLWWKAEDERCPDGSYRRKEAKCMKGANVVALQEWECAAHLTSTRPEETECPVMEVLTPAWVPGPYGVCTDGRKMRDVICQIGQNIVEDARCTSLRKPPDRQLCSNALASSDNNQVYVFQSQRFDSKGFKWQAFTCGDEKRGYLLPMQHGTHGYEPQVKGAWIEARLEVYEDDHKTKRIFLTDAFNVPMMLWSDAPVRNEMITTVNDVNERAVPPPPPCPDNAVPLWPPQRRTTPSSSKANTKKAEPEKTETPQRTDSQTGAADRQGGDSLKDPPDDNLFTRFFDDPAKAWKNATTLERCFIIGLPVLAIVCLCFVAAAIANKLRKE